MKLYNMELNANDILLVVDMQKDFMEDGPLPVPGTDQKFIDLVQEYIAYFGDFSIKGRKTIFTRDFHGADHSSFDVNGGQWPVHCVEFTKGCDGVVSGADSIIHKGMSKDFPGYSAFEDPKNFIYLPSRTQRIFVCGVALDFCVKETIKDIIMYMPGIEVFLLLDGTRAVKDFEGTIREMVRWGVNLISL